MIESEYVERYCILKFEATDVKIVAYTTLGAPMFLSESDALQYLEKRKDYNLFTISKVYTARKIAEAQTIKIA